MHRNILFKCKPSSINLHWFSSFTARIQMCTCVRRWDLPWAEKWHQKNDTWCRSQEPVLSLHLLLLCTSEDKEFPYLRRQSDSRPFSWLLPTWECLTCACKYGAWPYVVFALVPLFCSEAEMSPLLSDLLAVRHEFPILAWVLPAVPWAAKESCLVIWVFLMNFVKQLF